MIERQTGETTKQLTEILVYLSRREHVVFASPHVGYSKELCLQILHAAGITKGVDAGANHIILSETGARIDFASFEQDAFKYHRGTSRKTLYVLDHSHKEAELTDALRQWYLIVRERNRRNA